MAEAPVGAPPQPGARAPSAQRRAQAARMPAPVTPAQRHRLSEELRASNRARIGLVLELRCECGRPACRDTLPLVAELHRGMAERFVVMPAHFNGGVVVRAADRFFVVDSAGRALPQSQRGLR